MLQNVVKNGGENIIWGNVKALKNNGFEFSILHEVLLKNVVPYSRMKTYGLHFTVPYVFALLF